MTQWLDSLPFDILFGIALYLDIEDVVNLHNASRQLRFLLDEESLCRKVIESHASTTLEAEEARSTGYGHAIRRIFKRRAALAAGRPAYITSLGYAADAIYADGIVCLLEQSHVLILDLHRGQGRRRMPIRILLGEYAPENATCDWNCIQLLSYHQNVLVLKYTDDDNANWLMALDVSQPRHVSHLIEPERLRSVAKLFVLQTTSIVFYGTRSASATWCSQPFREWLIQGISLDGTRFNILKADGSYELSSKSERIQLHGFAGSELGSTAAFKIHDGYFYAVTNYDAFDVIEVDFTSYYHCIRFPVADAQKATTQAARTIFRRQHEDGPVNDGWNTLDIQVDERTNELVIVEGRAEWLSGSRGLSRAVYSHKLNWDDHEVEAVEDRAPQRGPMNNPLSKIPDAETKYCPTPVLDHWHEHMEEDNERQTRTRSVAPALSRSKFRGYNFSTMSSIELVERPCACRGTDVFCLHLRSCSRRLRPLTDRMSMINQRNKNKTVASPGESTSRAARALTYNYSPISLWPSESESMHEILNLPVALQQSRSADVKAWLDERSVIYFISSTGFGKVVCLTFDGNAPVTRFPLDATLSIADPGCRPRGRSPRPVSDPEHTRQISPARDAWDHPIFESKEAQEGFFVSTWDLEDIPDAEDLGSEVLEPWFKSFGLVSNVSTTSC